MPLETNIRQRGDIGGSAKKVGLRIKELERIYGIREGSYNVKGSNMIGEPNNSADQFTQSDLAAQMGISVDTLQNYKILADMPTFFADAVSIHSITFLTYPIMGRFRRYDKIFAHFIGLTSGGGLHFFWF